MIQILYFEGCPHRDATVALARNVLSELGISEEIEEVEVRDDEDARRLRFLGSPTLRVNGVDIEPDMAYRTHFAFACRTYGASGVPQRELLVAALERASGKHPKP